MKMSGNSAVFRRADPWRWMILASRFFVTFLVVGSFKSMGVFLPYIQDGFDTNTEAAGYVSSSSLGFGFVCIGPFFGIVTKTWSPRRISILGGSVTALCMFGSACSSSIVSFATLIAICSLGEGFVDIAVIQPVVDYFPEDFALANGLSLAGGTLGIMILPPVMEYLLSLYGWRSALGIMAAFSSNLVVCGALLRPCRNMQGKYRPLDQQNDIQNETSTEINSEKRLENLNNGQGTVFQMLRKLFDTELLTQPIFILYQVLSLLLGLIYSMWHLFLIPLGVQLGHGETLAAFLATFGGVGALIGRLGHGYPIDRKLLQSSSVFLGGTLLFAASSLTTPLVMTSYPALATLSTISGIAIGAIAPLIYVLVLEFCPNSSKTAFGWIFFSFGTGTMLGGFSAGWIHDICDDYNIVFVVMGAFSVVMSAVLVLTRCLIGQKDGK